MADDLIAAPGWSNFRLEKSNNSLEEKRITSVLRHENSAGFPAGGGHANNGCKHSESRESDSESTVGVFRGDNLVKKASENGSASPASTAIHAESNGQFRYRVFEEARDHGDDERVDVDNNCTDHMHSEGIQSNFMRFQDIVSANPDVVSDALLQVTNSLSTAMAAEHIDLMNAAVGLGRAQSAKEPGPKEERYLGDLNFLREHCKSLNSSLAKTDSGSMIPDMKLKADSAAVLNGLIRNIKAEAEILERALSSVTNSSDTNKQHNHDSGNGEMPTGGLSNCLRSGSTEPNQDPSTVIDEQELETSPIEQVALIVPNTDDPSIPVWTFRTVVLGVLSCILITFLNTYFSYRTEPIIITATTVLIATTPVGNFMASVLPNKFVRWPGTQRGFSLNPGPFNMKEHALITIFASAGSVRPGGIFVFNIVKVFLNGHLGFIPGFIVTLTCELFGYSWAVVLQKFLVEPARMWWPGSLVNVSLVRGLHLDDRRKGISPLQFFLMVFIVACAYYVVPGFFVPSIRTVSIVCLIFKHNVRAQQLGSGQRGLGLGAFSLDWATISAFLGSPLVVPWTAVVNIVVGFVIQAYLVAPLTYWKNWFRSKNFPIFSSDIFTKSGLKYDVSQIRMDSDDPKVNRLKLGIDGEGLTYFSAFYNMSTGFTFALFGAVFSQVICFNGKDLIAIFRASVNGKQIDSVDIHTKLMRRYPPVPLKWIALLYLGTHVLAIVNLLIYKDQLEMRWWGVPLASLFSGILVVPLGVLVATTNQTPNLGIIPQYLMGIISNGEPITNIMFRTYAAVVVGRTTHYLANMKLGHYMKVPPMATFYCQLISTGIAAIVSTLVALWLTTSINNICDTAKLPHDTPWTCPLDRVFYDQTIAFGIIGPRRLFMQSDAPYRTLNYYFLPGFFLPIAVWLLRSAFPKQGWISRINATLIVRGAFLMPPSPVANNTMWIYIALFFSIYVFGYKKEWWKRYNYMLSAALDAGTVFMAILLYYALDEGKEKLSWWGERGRDDHCPLAHCPTAHGVISPGCPVN